MQCVPVYMVKDSLSNINLRPFRKYEGLHVHSQSTILAYPGPGTFLDINLLLVSQGNIHPITEILNLLRLCYQSSIIQYAHLAPLIL